MSRHQRHRAPSGGNPQRPPRTSTRTGGEKPAARAVKLSLRHGDERNAVSTAHMRDLTSKRLQRRQHPILGRRPHVHDRPVQRAERLKITLVGMVDRSFRTSGRLFLPPPFGLGRGSE